MGDTSELGGLDEVHFPRATPAQEAAMLLTIFRAAAGSRPDSAAVEFLRRFRAPRDGPKGH